MLLSLSFVPLHGFTPILLVAVTLGIVASAQGPLADSLALALNREGKLEYGPVRAAGSIAYMVVTAITGQLLALLGATLVPWLQALGYGLAAVFSRLLPEAASPPSAPRVLGGQPLLRGIVCGLMTTLGGIGHTLPYLIPSVKLGTEVAIAVVIVELAIISWIRHRFMDTNWVSATLQVVVGGILVFLTGMLIGSS